MIIMDIDIKDKIVLMMTGSPQSTDPDELNSVFNMDIERPKIMSAFSQGAKAILCVYDPRNKYPDAYASGLADMGVGKVGTKMISLKLNESSAPVQIAFITRYAADNLLKKSGYNLKTIQEKISYREKACLIRIE